MCQRTVYCQQPTRNDPIQRTICCLANFTLYSIHAPVRILKLKKKSFVTAQRVHYFAPFHCAAALIPPRKYRKITRVHYWSLLLLLLHFLLLLLLTKARMLRPLSNILMCVDVSVALPSLPPRVAVSCVDYLVARVFANIRSSYETRILF